MAALARRAQRDTNIWPGYVDALASLLMVIIFLLMIFALAQFIQGQAISGRDTTIDKLRNQVSELADLLSLERRDNQQLRTSIDQLSSELQASLTEKEDLAAQLQSMNLRAESAEEQAQKVKAELEDAFKTITADKEKIELQLRQIASLTQDVEALKALREELQAEVAKLGSGLKEKETALTEERKLSEAAKAQVALLNRQIKALREQISKLAETLEASETLAKEQKVQIASLGTRLNAALAGKVQELQRYRSEFFGRLRTLLGNQPGIRIVGDRFVFQSEVLFATGSAELGPEGKQQMAQLGETLKEIAVKIPNNINWILRVDGHTDKVPIATAQYPSNWELSTARAISVVKFLIDLGIDPENLAATGFGEFQPIDPRDDEIAFRRNRRIELKLDQR